MRNTLCARGTIDRSTEFKLIEPESFIDAFDTDTFDHFRGLFELRIVPMNGNTAFPKKWRLKTDADIKFEIKQDTPTTLEIRNNQGKECKKPLSVAHSLELSKERTLYTFLEQVHKSTDDKKGTVDDWKEDLKNEGITEYEDLERLDEQDWQRMKSPSMMVRKLLKMHLERQRHTGKTGTNNNSKILKRICFSDNKLNTF